MSSLWLRKNAIHRFTWGLGWAPRQVSRHRHLGHDESELRELRVDTRCAPAILSHGPDEPANLAIHSRSSRITSPRDLFPVSPESIRFQRPTVSALTMTKRLAHPNYNVTSDGQTFVMVAAADTEADRVHVVVNWIEELKSLVFSVED